MATIKTRKKSKTHGVRWWKKKAWDEFSKYIRKRDALKNEDTGMYFKCCTCGKVYPAFGKGCGQAGHYVAGRKNSYLFEEHGCHAQCYNCNINLKGNTILYRKFMIETYGLEETERIEQLFFVNKEYRIWDLEEIYNKYKEKLGSME